MARQAGTFGLVDSSHTFQSVDVPFDIAAVYIECIYITFFVHSFAAHISSCFVVHFAALCFLDTCYYLSALRETAIVCWMTYY